MEIRLKDSVSMTLSLLEFNAEILQGRGSKDPPSTRQLSFTLEIDVNDLAIISRGYIKQTITHQRLI